MPIPVIIDTDPGIDDAVAILLALASPELQVLGLTTVGGNAGIARTTDNARRLLHLAGRDEIPVGAGAAQPLVRADTRPDPSIHGEDGLGGAPLEPAVTPVDFRPAVQLLADLIEGSPDPVTVIAIGPLTNLATLAAARPDTFARIGRLVIMGGGARMLGNVTAAAEFNIWFDPEAAARVFAAGVPLTMVGLDVTRRAVTVPDDWTPLREAGGPVARGVLPMIDYYTAYHRASYGTDGVAQHDALAVASVIAPELIVRQACHVEVETAGTFTRGMTVCDLADVQGLPANAEVAVDLDPAAFTRLLVDRLTGVRP